MLRTSISVSMLQIGHCIDSLMLDAFQFLERTDDMAAYVQHLTFSHDAQLAQQACKRFSVVFAHRTGSPRVSASDSKMRS